MISANVPGRINHYRLGTLLGHTRNSNVYATRQGASQLAIKVIEISRVPAARLKNECQNQSLVTFPYIMPVHQFFDFQGLRCLIMPQALGGSLFDLAMDPGRCHPVAIAKIFYRAIKALSLLHSVHILHGDVKPGNILLKTRDSEDPRPYIIDFGHSRNLSLCDVCTCKLMTCHYGSPEVLALAEHSFPSDVWSTALSFHFVITGIESINGSDLSAMAKQAANLRLSFDHPNWSQYPTSIQSLLLAMTNKDPGRRPTMAACMGDRFFIEFLGEDWITLEDEAVKLPGSEEMRELLLRVKEAAMEEEDDTIH